MRKRIPLGLVTILSILFGIYPLTYLLPGLENDQYLATKSLDVLNSILWQSLFNIHIVASGISLLLGWIQFVKSIRRKALKFHRYVGRIYFLTVVIGGFSGVYLAYHSNTLLSQTGFAALSFLWLYTSFKALSQARHKNFRLHEKWATRSYALAFSAVTFRICLVSFTSFIDSYELAFGLSTWSCWILNLSVVEMVLRYKRT